MLSRIIDRRRLRNSAAVHGPYLPPSSIFFSEKRVNFYEKCLLDPYFEKMPGEFPFGKKNVFDFLLENQRGKKIIKKGFLKKISVINEEKTHLQYLSYWRKSRIAKVITLLTR